MLPYGIKLVHGDRPLRKIDLKPETAKGVDGQDAHVRNFLDCVKSRALPTCDIEIAHRSTNTCHLGNISYKLGRKLEWDAETETFKNDPEANALLKREPRKGYELPAGLSIGGTDRTAIVMRDPMKRPPGISCGISRLLIEMLGIWGVYRSTGDKDQARLAASRRHRGPAGRGSPSGVGFVLWLTGTILVYASAAKRKTPSPGRIADGPAKPAAACESTLPRHRRARS